LNKGAGLIHRAHQFAKLWYEHLAEIPEQIDHIQDKLQLGQFFLKLKPDQVGGKQQPQDNTEHAKIPQAPAQIRTRAMRWSGILK
jgi:hypothetical protein